MDKFELGVFIGRFQPFHKGHWWNLEQVLKRAKKIVIIVGSIQEKGTRVNPWGFEERKKMVEKALKKLRKEDRERILGIGGVMDYPRDEDWVQAVKQEIERLGGEVSDWSQVVVVGNNEWTNRSLEEIGGLSVWRSGLYRRDLYEGKKIRKLIEDGDERWKERVVDKV